MKRPHILMLAHRIPFPPDKGDKIRSWRLLRYLAERADVSLGCFIDDEDDWQHTETVRALCRKTLFVPLLPGTAVRRSAVSFLTGRSITEERYRDARLSSWVADRKEDGIDALVGFSAGVMPHLLDGAPLLADLCDVDSAKWEAYAADGRGWKAKVYARESKLCRALEARVAEGAARTFLVTPEERDLFLTGGDHFAGKVDYYRNGVDTEYFRPGIVPPARGACDVVFTGAMDYRANALAAVQFADEIWPRIAAEAPDATFAIVGARPTAEVEALSGRPGIKVTGRVDDVRPWLAGAKVAVAPLVVARGVQNKVLEAMAMGTPLVTSPAAAAGTTAVPGRHLLTVAGTAEMAEAVLTLLSDRSEAERLAANARELAERDFGWDAALSRFGRALAQILPSC